MKLKYLGHTETKLWFEQMELYSRRIVQYGHNPRIVATIFVRWLSQLQMRLVLICYFGLIFHLGVSGVPHHSQAYLHYHYLLICPSIFISLMSTDKLVNEKARKVNITITYSYMVFIGLLLAILDCC